HLPNLSYARLAIAPLSPPERIAAPPANFEAPPITAPAPAPPVATIAVPAAAATPAPIATFFGVSERPLTTLASPFTAPVTIFFNGSAKRAAARKKAIATYGLSIHGMKNPPAAGKT